MSEQLQSDAPLRATVEDGKLIISIGVGRLAWASKPENNGPLKKCDVEKGREEEWANDVAREMCQEDETGDTALNRFLDRMMKAAANEGSGAVVWKQNGELSAAKRADE